ncbi:hypothetical protein ACX80O_02255 [Arthrobacter sp. Hz1]
MNPATRFTSAHRRLLSATLVLGGFLIILLTGQLLAPTGNGAQILGSVLMIAGALKFVSETGHQP